MVEGYISYKNQRTFFTYQTFDLVKIGEGDFCKDWKYRRRGSGDSCLIDTAQMVLADLVGPMHKVHIYLEYHSVCPLVGIGTLPTLSRQRVCPSPRNRG